MVLHIIPSSFDVENNPPTPIAFMPITHATTPPILSTPSQTISTITTPLSLTPIHNILRLSQPQVTDHTPSLLQVLTCLAML